MPVPLDRQGRKCEVSIGYSPKRAVTSDATVTNTAGEILPYLYSVVLNFQLPTYLQSREARDDRKPDHI